MIHRAHSNGGDLHPLSFFDSFDRALLILQRQVRPVFAQIF